jgi:Carboxypeptidase regulatory-like domain
MIPSKRHLVWLSLLLFAAAAHAPAQTTFASVTGTVTDSSGSVVPNVAVTATNVKTGVKTATKSNQSGNYTIPQLIEGAYSVDAQAPGFRQFVVQDVLLASRDERRVDIKLEVGSVQSAIEVKSGATLIETETARISNTKDSLVLNTLPLNTRSIWAYLSLSPGVQQQPGSSVVRFGGSRVNQENWSIDGTTFSDGVDNTQTGPLANYIESFQEVKVDLANNSAEFSSIGQVTLISKSGTNEFHGSAFDYYSTPFFRARDPFSPERATGIRHQPGFTVGGPVFIPKIYKGKNKTFFFFSYETARGSQQTQLLNPTVPLPAWRTGDFSSLGVTIYDPLTNQPFAGNKIPSNRINPVSQKIQDRFYPMPNFGDPNTFHSSNYREAKTRAYDPSTYWTTRIDHKFSDTDSVFGRYTWQRLYNRPYEGNLPTIGQRFQQRDDRAATVSYTHLFGPTMVNEIRWGFGFNNNPITPPVNGLSEVNDLGLQGLAPNLPNYPGLFTVNWAGINLQSLSQLNYRNPGYRTHTEEVQEHFNWFHGRHNLKFGWDMLRSEYDDFGAPANLYGNVTFSSKFTSGGIEGQGDPYADFLLGIPTKASRAFPSPRVDRNRWSQDFFVLDDFKVNQKLTVNIGLRYEPHFNWRENHNLMSLFDVKSGAIVIPDGASSEISPIFPKNYVPIKEAHEVPGFDGKTLVRTDLNKFAPRVGAAYRPWGENTVFRAGWGIYYDVVPFVYALDFGDIPFILNEPSFTNPTTNPIIFPTVFPASGVGGPSTVGIPTAQNPGYRTPYSMQYNFTIERQQWGTGFRLSYIGTAMRRAPWGYNYNSPVPNDVPYIDKPRPFSTLPDITYVTNGAGHQYNGLTVEAQRHFAGGLYFQSSWTWARDRYDMDYNWDLANSSFISEDPTNRHREIGPSPDIPTHRFNLNYIYEFPVGKGKHFLPNLNRAANLLLGGWSTSGVFTYQTGQFLTPLWEGPDPVGISYTESDPADVVLRPDILHNPNLPSDKRSIYNWFDTTAFAPPQPGHFGTSGKGVVIGPGVNVWHMGLHKDFIFNERGTRLRWEMTATNIFNHPNWGNPDMNVADGPGAFGVITDATGATNGSTGDQLGSRSFRMGLRLQW